MLRRFRDRGAQLRFPGLQRLTRPRINQIKRRSFERRLCDADGGERFGGGMSSSEPGERGVVERLYAERNAIDAGRAKAMEPLCLNAGRIGFKGDFRVRRHGPMARYRIEHGRNRSGCISDGVPPPMKIVDDRATRRCARRRWQSPASNAAAKRLIDCGRAHVAVEVAVRALRQTERPMDVDAERLAHQDTPPRA